ncbi:tellurite resistance TerB family protein [Luteimonas deserti]|uniref:Tellurite resistance TerB family protein n=1 Tax=Luteimonas deserti TaxID=2752306 RepID=A0A7Z0TZR2_9GAMM|nr:tellurite resistance TerB family protein [Luteimonas deserti]NYZ63682.1 tellurite resistance TerB family protein [Luteimonas deserti]
MSFQGFLNHLLTSQAGGAPGTSLLNADFGKGAATGGALGLLLGKNRKTRKLATYGGLAAIGMMAYRAYGDYQRQQTGAGAPAPQTVDRLPPPQVDLHSQAILRALVGAAKADGHLDAREREVIEAEFRRVDAGADIQPWLHAELEKPLDPADIAGAAQTPELASEMYLASVLVVDDTNFMERSYLDELARQLRLAPELKTRLEEEVRAASRV